MDYSNIENIYQTNKPAYNYLVKMLFPMVRSWIQDNLSVKGNQVVSPTRSTCYKATVPNNMRNRSVAADLIIIVTAENAPKESYVAWATSCQQDRNTLRPNMGQVNMNLHYLDTNIDRIYDVFGTVIHEVTHV